MVPRLRLGILMVTLSSAASSSVHKEVSAQGQTKALSSDEQFLELEALTREGEVTAQKLGHELEAAPEVVADPEDSAAPEDVAAPEGAAGSEDAATGLVDAEVAAESQDNSEQAPNVVAAPPPAAATVVTQPPIPAGVQAVVTSQDLIAPLHVGIRLDSDDGVFVTNRRRTGAIAENNEYEAHKFMKFIGDLTGQDGAVSYPVTGAFLVVMLWLMA